MNDTLKNRKQFPFYRSFMDALDKATNNQRLELYDAIIHYSFLGINPKFEDKTCDIFWALIKPNLDSPMQKYINGSNGGAPKGSHNNPDGRRGKKTNQELTKNKPKTNQELSKEEEEEEEEEERDDNLSNFSLSDEQFSHLDSLVSETTHFKNLSYPMTKEQWNKLYSGWDFGTMKFSLIIKELITECDRYLCNPEGTKKVGAYEMIIDKLEHKGYKKKTI